MGTFMLFPIIQKETINRTRNIYPYRIKKGGFFFNRSYTFVLYIASSMISQFLIDFLLIDNIRRALILIFDVYLVLLLLLC